MILDINVFTPEVLATLIYENGNIMTTEATCRLLGDNDDLNGCGDCPFLLVAGCIDEHYQILLAKHFPELFV